MISRGIAAFLGAFTLLNLLGNVFAPGFDANPWLLDFSPLPVAIGATALLLGGVALLAHAIRPARSKNLRVLCAAPVAALALVALLNGARFYLLLHQHRITTSVPIPFSLPLCAILGFVSYRILRPAISRPAHGRLMMAGAFVLCVVGFPLAQIYFFGHTDYRRRADIIVVFGARALANGSPSAILADRVRTGCQLYRDGLADTILFSGGPGDGAVDEPHAMRRLALQLGVPDSAIRLDPDGLNTEATVRNSEPILRTMHARRVLAVSHAYHLPRIKMAYHQAGWDVSTVPAAQRAPLPRGGSFLLAREVVAIWAYYLHPLRLQTS